MGLIAVVIFTLVLAFWILRPFQQVKRTPGKPRHKQYKDSRLSDYMIAKIMKAYNVSEKPEPDEEENDFIEYEENDEPSPVWSDQQPQFDSCEAEDAEARSKSHDSLSTLLEIVGLLWLCGIILAEENVPGAKMILEGKTSFAFVIKVFPALLLMVALIVQIFSSRSKSSGEHALMIFRSIVLLLIGVGYAFNQLSDFLLNSK